MWKLERCSHLGSDDSVEAAARFGQVSGDNHAVQVIKTQEVHFVFGQDKPVCTFLAYTMPVTKPPTDKQLFHTKNGGNL